MRTVLLGLLWLTAVLPACCGGDLDAFRDPTFQDQALHLARTALQDWVQGRAVRIPTDLHPALYRQAGVFVSLENRQLRVRGCRGTLLPRTSRLADEIVANVREAGLRDPLHPRIKVTELGDIRIVLCVPGDAVRAWSDEAWDVHQYGVLVESGDRAAVMLPWEAPDSLHQILWGRRKAHIGDTEPVHLERFPGVRFAESFEAVDQRAASPRPNLPYW